MRPADSQGGAIGSWGKAIEVPGLEALNTGREAEVGSVSCGSAGNCATGGYYTFHGGNQGAFVASERNGRWGTAISVPGFRALNKCTDGVDISDYFSVSCAPAGTCTAGGYYIDASGHDQGFVTQEKVTGMTTRPARTRRERPSTQTAVGRDPSKSTWTDSRLGRPISTPWSPRVGVVVG